MKKQNNMKKTDSCQEDGRRLAEQVKESRGINIQL